MSLPKKGNCLRIRRHAYLNISYEKPPAMRKIQSVLVIVCLLSISCTKTTDSPVPSENPKLRSINSLSAPLEKRFALNGQDTVLLKLVMEPALTCYSYNTGQTPKPCDIFIDFICTLSRPVDGYVEVHIKKNNLAEFTNAKPSGTETDSDVIFNVSPSTTKFTFRSSLRNNSNVTVAENRFRIENVTFYNKTD